jgi:hypothetical protein
MARPINPSEVFDEGRFLSGDKDLPKADKPKKKTKKKSKSSPCGQGSLSGSTYKG